VRLIVRAYAKINLGLTVLGRRPDGYHELVTVYQSVSLHDILRFETPARTLSFACDAEGVPAGRDNLVYRAALAFARATGREPRVRIVLDKKIPPRAGLGGGSSDAAVTLLALERLSSRPLGPERLGAVAAGLGSDVPFFLKGGTALGLGRGEILRPLRDLEPRHVVILKPPFGVSTAEAFRRVESSLTPPPAQTSIYRFSRQWVRGTRGYSTLGNDLEEVLARSDPRLARLVGALEARGASVAAMTGSGSAVYGVFEGGRRADRAFRHFTRSSEVARAWLVRTVGASEYAAKVQGRGSARTSA